MPLLLSTYFSATSNPPSLLAPIPPAAQKERGGRSGCAGRDGRTTKKISFMKDRQKNISSSTKD